MNFLGIAFVIVFSPALIQFFRLLISRREMKKKGYIKNGEVDKSCIDILLRPYIPLCFIKKKSLYCFSSCIGKNEVVICDFLVLFNWAIGLFDSPVITVISINITDFSKECQGIFFGSESLLIFPVGNKKQESLIEFNDGISRFYYNFSSLEDIKLSKSWHLIVKTLMRFPEFVLIVDGSNLYIFEICKFKKINECEKIINIWNSKPTPV